MRFASVFRFFSRTHFPEFSGTRIMMMPVVIGDPNTVPQHYRELLSHISPAKHKGEVGYLTIDERNVPAGQTHRRPGLHVDSGGWGGGWGSRATGMITVSSNPACKAHYQFFDGEPDEEGNCEHLRDQCQEGLVLNANTAYWLSGLCVHESLPTAGERQFVRLSLPSDAPWYEGYTPSPYGVQPTGPIMGPRPTSFMEHGTYG